MKKVPLVPILIFLFSCGTKDSPPTAAVSKADVPNTVTVSKDQFETAGIELGHIENRPLSGSIQVTGMLDVPPQNLVNITAPFGGFLRSTDLLQGMRVVRGQVIAVIENPEYIQLQQDFLDTRSQVVFLETEHERQQQLAKENVNSQKTYQKSLADLNSMKARNYGLQAKLKMININPDRLDYGKITSTIELRSPIEGFVTQINSSIGAFDGGGDFPIVQVDTDHVHAELTCFERDLLKVRIGQKIRFILANESKERTATVFLVGKEITPDRTVRIHGHLDKDDGNLIPGMYLKAEIETGSQSFPSLPEEAVLILEDKRFIFAKESGNGEVFKLVEVTVGVHDNNFIEVIAPVDFDIIKTPVVVKNAYKLLSKMKNEE